MRALADQLSERFGDPGSAATAPARAGLVRQARQLLELHDAELAPRDDRHPSQQGCPPSGGYPGRDSDAILQLQEVPESLVVVSGGLVAPLIQSTFVLNDVQVQVRSSSSVPWSTLRSYRLGYSQSGPSTITDPVSGLPQSVAGSLLLKQVQQTGADETSSLPAQTFDYSQVTQYYEDSLAVPAPAGNCGPSWNTGGNGVPCILWSQSYMANSWYLSSAGNGQGLAQAFTWNNARSNMHGVNGGGEANTRNPSTATTRPWRRSSPATCPTTRSGAGPCSPRGARPCCWSASRARVAASSTPVTGTTRFSYEVPHPLAAQICSSCVAGFYWGSQKDLDYLDYYNNKFMGFAKATVAARRRTARWRCTASTPPREPASTT